MPRPALLAVSHGTSDPVGAAAIAGLVAAVAARLPGVDVRAGFVDVQQPDAASALDRIDGPAVIVPLLLSVGFHVRNDVGGLLRTRADAVIAPPLGPDPRLAEVLAARIAEAGADPDAPVVLAVAGSRDPDSPADAEATAGLLALRLGRPVSAAYLAARDPRLPDALAMRPGAVVATYLLAQGFFSRVAQEQAGAHSLTAPLLRGDEIDAPPAALVDLVLARYVAGEARLAARDAALATPV